MVGITAVITTLRYDDAIVLPGKDKDSINLVFLSMILNFLISVFLLVTIILTSDILEAFLNLPEGRKYILYLVPLGSFLLNIFQAFNYWLVRKKEFGAVSINKIIRRGTEGASQIVFAIARKNTGLLLSDLVGQAANSVATIFRSFRTGFDPGLISITKLCYVARKYTDFPKYSLIPALMSACSFLLPPLMITRMYSAGSAGLFDAAKSFLSIPIALVSVSFSSVLLQKISNSYNLKKSIYPEIRQSLLIIASLAIAEIAVILLLAPVIFRIYFGNQWDDSATIARIMVWSYSLNFVVSSFTCLFFAMRKIKIYSLWQIFYFGSIITLLFFNKLDFLPFLRLYVGIEAACYLALLGIMFFMVRNYEKTARSVL